MQTSTNIKSKLIFFTLSGWIFDFFDLILYSFLLVWIQIDFKLTNSEVGIIYSASLAITAVGGIFLGFLGDKIGRRPAIMLSILIFSVGTAMSALSTGLYSLLIWRLITGFGIGGEWAAGHTLINETLPTGERGRASAIIQSGAPIGAGIASFIGGFITPVIGWRMSFLIASIPSFILVVLMYIYLDESPQYIIFKAEANDYAEENIPRGYSYIRMVMKHTFKNLHSVRKELNLGTLLSLWGMIAYWIIFSWTPKYLNILGFEDHQIGYWMLLSQLGAFIGYISFGWVAYKINNTKFAFSIYSGLFSGGILLFTQGGSIDLSLFGIFITGLGTGFFSGYGPIYSKLFPTKVRNTCSSFCFNCGRMGAFIAPLLVAQIAYFASFGFAISMGALFAIILGLWIWLIPIKEYTHEYQIERDNRDKIQVII